MSSATMRLVIDRMAKSEYTIYKRYRRLIGCFVTYIEEVFTVWKTEFPLMVS